MCETVGVSGEDSSPAAAEQLDSESLRTGGFNLAEAELNRLLKGQFIRMGGEKIKKESNTRNSPFWKDVNVAECR